MTWTDSWKLDNFTVNCIVEPIWWNWLQLTSTMEFSNTRLNFQIHYLLNSLLSSNYYLQDLLCIICRHRKFGNVWYLLNKRYNLTMWQTQAMVFVGCDHLTDIGNHDFHGVVILWSKYQMKVNFPNMPKWRGLSNSTEGFSAYFKMWQHKWSSKVLNYPFMSVPKLCNASQRILIHK